MPRFPSVMFVAALVIVVTLLSVEASAADQSDAEVYGALRPIADADLSTNGKYIAAKVLLQGEYILGIYELPVKAGSQTWYKRYDNGKIRWIDWANHERLLVAIEFQDKIQGTPITQTRLLSINFDGTEPKNMVKQANNEVGESLTQFQDNVVDMLPEDPDHILIAFARTSTWNGAPEVRRVNVYTGKSKLVESSQEDITSWMTDRNGVVRIGWGIAKKRGDSFFKMVLRDGKKGKWQNVSSRFTSDGKRAFDDNVTFTPMGFDADPNILFVLSNHESDIAALYRYDIAADTFVEKVYGRDDVEISGLELDSTGRRVIGVRYVVDEPEVHYLTDDADAKLRQQISKMFGGDDVRMVSMTSDNSSWVIRVTGSRNPGGLFVLNKAAGKLDPIGSFYPGLKSDDVLPIETVSYSSRDEVDIPAYVTLPPNTATLAAARELPFVILPHGGPYARDFKTFDYLPQFLASRGYGVLQMNFRGSTGYGTQFEMSGSQEWGELMQDDITDGVNWLVESGYADSSKICIVGWSYGAYAALAGSVKTPDLYRCAAGMAGVYDLPRMVKSQLRYRNGEFLTRRIGKLWSDDKKLQRNSPARRADEITVPVFVAHAADDQVVPVRQSHMMRDALVDAGKKIEYVEFEKGGHSLLSSDRAQLLARLETFLAEHLK